jgi:hypothetical protein
METIGEDLILLAIRPNGNLGAVEGLRFGLSGSELVRLAAARRVDIVGGRIVTLDTTPTGDPLLDAALPTMAGNGKRQPKASAWVGRPHRGLVDRYLDRLAAAGTIRAERGKVLGIFPVRRWKVMDTGRLGQARETLDAIASGAAITDASQAAFAGLAQAVGLPAVLYPGRAGARARENLKRAATHGRRAAQPASAGTDAPADASVRAAADAAIAASIDAATHAAIDAAVDAATHAATQAAQHAAAQHAAAHGGASAGGHH